MGCTRFKVQGHKLAPGHGDKVLTSFGPVATGLPLPGNVTALPMEVQPQASTPRQFTYSNVYAQAVDNFMGPYEVQDPCSLCLALGQEEQALGHTLWDYFVDPCNPNCYPQLVRICMS